MNAEAIHNDYTFREFHKAYTKASKAGGAAALAYLQVMIDRANLIGGQGELLVSPKAVSASAPPTTTEAADAPTAKEDALTMYKAALAAFKAKPTGDVVVSIPSNLDPQGLPGMLKAAGIGFHQCDITLGGPRSVTSGQLGGAPIDSLGASPDGRFWHCVFSR